VVAAIACDTMRSWVFMGAEAADFQQPAQLGLVVRDLVGDEVGAEPAPHRRAGRRSEVGARRLTGLHGIEGEGWVNSFSSAIV
jgi:hypothetical protein